MDCPKSHKLLTPIGKKDRTLRYRCTNPDCDVVKVGVERSREGEAVTIIDSQSNCITEGGDAMKR